MEKAKGEKVTAAQGAKPPDWLASMLRVTLIAALPLVLVLLNARALMTDAFLRWEYNRPYFPPDSYGFTTEERLTYAPSALTYLFNDAGIDFLSDQTFPDGSPLYNQRELDHMHDVKVVTDKLTTVGLSAIALLVLSIAALGWKRATHPILQQALLRGSVFTLALLLGLIFFVTVGFNAFFTQFHALFFEGGSWMFPTSDTLIRLFPEQFWVDASSLLFGGAMVEALAIGCGAWWWGRQMSN